MNEISPQLLNALLIGALLSIPFKAVALWKAAQNGQKAWFGAMLILNTLAVLELTYLFYFSEKKKQAK